PISLHRARHEPPEVSLVMDTSTPGIGRTRRLLGGEREGPRGDAGRRSRGESAAGPSPLLVGGLIVFLALEYLRPPLLQPLGIQRLFLIGLPVAWLASREHAWSRALTLQLAFLVTGALALPFAFNYFVVYMETRIMYGYLVTAVAVTWLLAWRRPFQ